MMKILKFGCLSVGLMLATNSQAQVTLKEIEDTVADLSCDTSAQCKAIGIGRRQCGGPAYFSVYSSKTVDEPKLNSMVSQYNNSITFPPDSTGACVFANTPVAACVASKCEATSDAALAYGSGDKLTINIPAVVYVKGVDAVRDANGVYHVETAGKELYQVRLESFVDEKDGQLKFRIGQLIKQP